MFRLRLGLTLGLLPAPVHVAGLRVVHAVRVRWWRLARRRVSGCRALVLDGQDRVLLIRHSYGNGYWMLPGGGLGRGEDPEAGAAREVIEECGVEMADPVLIGQSQDASGLFETFVVAGRVPAGSILKPDGREVVVAGFFAVSSLPEPIWPSLARLLPEWIRAAKAARRAG